VPPAPEPAGVLRRRAGLALLALVLTLLHLALVDGVWDARLGEGAAEAPLRRIELAFVRELQQAAPLTVAPAAPRRVVPARVQAPAAAASAVPPPAEPLPAAEAPAGAAPGSASAASSTAPAPEPVTASIEPAAAASEAAVPVAEAAAPASPAFEWPPSTRLSYLLSGDYRGPLDGRAQVQWVRRGTRYQVHLDVLVGPAFAPLITRRMTSDGELTEAGLRPLRYDEETRIAWSAPRRTSLRFEPERVWLPGERSVDSVAGVQDAASQFVQLTWMFTRQPERLRPGSTVEFPLALPRRIGLWVFDVVGEELLDTPVGVVPAVRLRPQAGNARPGELSIEVWIAPTLQNLPVRILIRQDAQNYVDMLLERLPQQAEQHSDQLPKRMP